MPRKFVVPLAILMAGCLFLAGCATGNLPRDAAFFPYKRTDNLHVIVSKTCANVALGCIYAAFIAIYVGAQIGAGVNRQCW